MITLPRMAKVLRKVFESEARELARSMGVIQRERKLHGTTLALILVLGWLHQPQAGSSALARFAGTLGVQISKQGIEEHWTFRTAEWLYEVLLRAIGCVLSANAVAVALLRRFAGVYLEDGSSVVLPDAEYAVLARMSRWQRRQCGDESGRQTDAAAGSPAREAAGTAAARWTGP